jgi:predicted HD phosphohydrolase
MKCPGQDTQQWKPGDIFEVPCSNCGRIIEFFKDDTSRRCKGCGARVLNPKIDFGCAAYCAFADQCLRELPPEALAQRANIFKDRVACEMQRYFGPDQRRIRHAEQVAHLAEQILSREPGDYAVVMAAAYLHDIGIKEAEKRYQSSEARYQEELGPHAARTVLESLKADAKLVDEVCDIIGHHHHPRTQETDNFKVLYDADCIVNLEDASSEKPCDREKLAPLIGKRLLTETGKIMALERLSVQV